MSDRSAIYAVPAGDAAEMQRALRICMAGLHLPAALTCPRGGFGPWAVSFFLTKTAPHVQAAWSLAMASDSGALIAADAALVWPAASVTAGAKLLAQRDGAMHWPLARRFSAAVAGGQAAGHFATVMALQAAEFSIALLPLLQCVLYAEWHAAREESADAGVFFTEAAAVLPRLVSFLPQDASVHFIPAARAL
jgi:hypothetical protein